MTAPTTQADKQELPPFSGDDPLCPKCAHIGAHTAHRADGEHGSDQRPTYGRSARGERLERSCGRCGFVWDEALVHPADAIQQQLAAWLRQQLATAMQAAPTTADLDPADVDTLTEAVVDVISLAVLNLPATDDLMGATS